MPGVGVSAYSSAKHAIHGFFDSLRVEEMRNRIKVTLVCPGYVKTPIHDRSLGGDGKEVGSHKKTALFSWTEISVKNCATEILKATASNKTNVSFPLLVPIAIHLRGILGTSVFDWLMYGAK